MDEPLELPRQIGEIDPLLHERVLGVPLAYQVFCWVLVFVCASAFVGCLAVPYLVPGSFDALYLAFPAAVILGWLALGVAVAANRLRDRFVVDDAGISCIGPDGRVVSLPWNEVARVRIRNVLQRMELTDQQRTRRIHVTFQLSEFDTLALFVLQRTSTAIPGPAESPLWILPVGAFLVGAASILIFGGVLLAAWVISLHLLATWLLSLRAAEPAASVGRE